MIPVDDTSVPPGQNGTILMAADWIALAPGTAAPTTTGTQTAEPLPTSGTGDLVTYHNNATLKTIQGMVAGLPGQRWTHVSKGAGQVDFAHLHASGTALGKCKLFATTGLTSLAAGSGVAVFQYDATVTQWRLVAHEQGAWITPTFAGGDYTAATGTWTVDSGDVSVMKYRLRGRTVEVSFFVVTTSVSATPANLRRAVPGGFTATGTGTNAMIQVSDNGAAAALGMVSASGALMSFTSTIGGAGWAAATNTTVLNGSTAFEVT